MMILGSTSVSASEARTSKFSDADQSCLDAMKQVQDSYSSSTSKPLSPLAAALVRTCDSHPVKGVCEAASQVVFEKFASTPFNCGSNAAASVPLILPQTSDK